MNFIFYIGFLFSIVNGFVSEDCKDLSPLCSGILRHCKSPTYIKIMQKRCALSCRFCTLPVKPTTPMIIRDRIHNCFTMVDQCNDEKFKKYMERNCKRTCSTATPKPTTTISPDDNEFENTEASGISDNNEEQIIDTETNTD
ncbi:ShKT domain-containing protein [Strongyloides ratti]|uniref:ShKT domain-containing protein n=1 Tax=Strongyloides ratti TaxID=34506 RepID=A0A090L7M4_STRRB|nr:ShKT domain-containing protein [Strongyloides ratti]CEF64133.1 ShKT domain-containing protein [Strongyloides ratti]